jgi:hypothetical protein
MTRTSKRLGCPVDSVTNLAIVSLGMHETIHCHGLFTMSTSSRLLNTLHDTSAFPTNLDRSQRCFKGATEP